MAKAAAKAKHGEDRADLFGDSPAHRLFREDPFARLLMLAGMEAEPGLWDRLEDAWEKMRQGAARDAKTARLSDAMAFLTRAHALGDIQEAMAGLSEAEQEDMLTMLERSRPAAKLLGGMVAGVERAGWRDREPGARSAREFRPEDWE